MRGAVVGILAATQPGRFGESVTQPQREAEMTMMTDAQILDSVTGALRPLLAELQSLRDQVAALTAERDDLQQQLSHAATPTVAVVDEVPAAPAAQLPPAAPVTASIGLTPSSNELPVSEPSAQPAPAPFAASSAPTSSSGSSDPEQRSERLDELLSNHVNGDRETAEVLRLARFTTFRDLLGLDLSSLEALPGLHADTRTNLKALCMEAMRRASDTGAKWWIHQPAGIAVAHYDGLPAASSLGRFDGRMRSLLRSKLFGTIGEMKAWLDRPEAWPAGVGTKTETGFRARLALLDQFGPELVCFGGARPRGVRAVAERYLKHVSRFDEGIFEQRYREGATLEVIGMGQHVPVSRQYIDQRLKEGLSADRTVWGGVAAEAAERIFEWLDEAGQIVSIDQLRDEGGAVEPWMIELVRDIAGETRPLYVHDGWLTQLESSAFERFMRELRRDLRKASLLTDDWADFAELLEQAGITGSRELLSKTLEQVADLTTMDDRVTRRTISRSFLYESILADSERPLTITEVIEFANAQDAELRHTPQSVAAVFSRQPDVLHMDRALWLHRSRLSPELVAILDQYVAAALEAIRREPEKAHACEELLEQCHQELGGGDDRVTPFLLRDALLTASSDVRGWVFTLNVALRTADAHPVTIRDRIHTISQSMKQPMEFAELAQRVADDSGWMLSSVISALSSTEDIIKIGRGQAISLKALFGGGDGVDAAVAELRALVPAEDVVSGAMLPCSWKERVTKLAGANGNRRCNDALASKLEGVGQRIRGGFVWEDEQVGFWEAANPDHLFPSAVFARQAFAERLRSRYELGMAGVADDLLRDAIQNRMLMRIAAGWYARNDLATADLLAFAASVPELCNLAARDPDVRRATPNPAFWEALRAQLGLPDWLRRTW